MTAVQDRPAASASVKEEQPYVDTTPNRHTGWWLLGIFVVWVTYNWIIGF